MKKTNHLIFMDEPFFVGNIMEKWKIESELKAHSFDFVEEFRKTFSKEEYTLSVKRSIMTGYSIKIKSYEDFWVDWNKFKKLKGFL